MIPGFVDPHTHLAFVGDRDDEIRQRLAGASYADIAAAGGGIVRTVTATREASVDELWREPSSFASTRCSLCGTTTAEVKSGYGLETAAEIRSLEAIRHASARHPITVCADVPRRARGAEGARGQRERYVDAARRGDDSRGGRARPRAFRRRLLRGGGLLGGGEPADPRGLLEPTASASASTPTSSPGRGGPSSPRSFGARSADHLVHVSEAGIAALAGSGCVATLLPTAAFYLRLGRYAPARALVDAGVAVALATDVNPGGGLSPSLPFAMTLATFGMGLSLEEALCRGDGECRGLPRSGPRGGPDRPRLPDGPRRPAFGAPARPRPRGRSGHPTPWSRTVRSSSTTAGSSGARPGGRLRAEDPVLIRALSIHARYACQQSGVCCSSGWPIPVEPGVEEDLAKALEAGELVVPDGEIAPEGGEPSGPCESTPSDASTGEVVKAAKTRPPEGQPQQNTVRNDGPQVGTSAVPVPVAERRAVGEGLGPPSEEARRGSDHPSPLVADHDPAITGEPSPDCRVSTSRQAHSRVSGRRSGVRDLFERRANLPDGSRVVFHVVEEDHGPRCVFLERVGGNACAVHRQLGPERQAAACRIFPRVAASTPLGVGITLSHYCPTAAELLFDASEPLRIVEAPPAFAEGVDYEGLDARPGLGPLLRPGVLLGWDGVRVWEEHVVSILAEEGSPERAVTAIAELAESLRRWTPAEGEFLPFLDATLRGSRNEAGGKSTDPSVGGGSACSHSTSFEGGLSGRREADSSGHWRVPPDGEGAQPRATVGDGPDRAHSALAPLASGPGSGPSFLEGVRSVRKPGVRPQGDGLPPLHDDLAMWRWVAATVPEGHPRPEEPGTEADAARAMSLVDAEWALLRRARAPVAGSPGLRQLAAAPGRRAAHLRCGPARRPRSAPGGGGAGLPRGGSVSGPAAPTRSHSSSGPPPRPSRGPGAAGSEAGTRRAVKSRRELVFRIRNA